MTPAANVFYNGRASLCQVAEVQYGPSFFLVLHNSSRGQCDRGKVLSLPRCYGAADDWGDLIETFLGWEVEIKTSVGPNATAGGWHLAASLFTLPQITRVLIRYLSSDLVKPVNLGAVCF